MASPPLTTRLRVRYVECDMQGHVFNAHYLTWFDLAHTDALRAATGASYAELISRHGVDFVVAESNVRYLAPARYDDEVRIATTLTEATPRMIRFDYELFDQTAGTRLAHGFTKHIFCGRDFRPSKLPVKYRPLFGM
jgi:acyl-CoA thioester hydrolase